MTPNSTRIPTPATWSYFFIRLLFKFVLKIFYGSIVIENTELIPGPGEPCILCANHTNSLTDAVLLVAATPGLLRLTAKATQFGKPTFTSWLIESAGTVPIQRHTDYGPNEKVDNAPVMAKLMDALELGDTVCLFPEGASRFHPSIAPLKTGVARIVSDVLSRNRNDPDFEISILTCSVTYQHRFRFRSDVLITYNPPMRFKVRDHPELLAPVNYSEIRHLTARVHREISSGTLDSPSWELIRTAKLAAAMYAPLGTRMSLGDHTRVVRTFLEAFKMSVPGASVSASELSADELEEASKDDTELSRLHADLQEYDESIFKLGVKEDRIRRPLDTLTLLRRLVVRATWAGMLFTLCLPGLVLWTPIFLTTFYAVHQFKKTGPVWDTYDEIAQYKLIYGLMSGLLVWTFCVLLNLSLAPVSFVGVPIILWLSLRWLEDAVSSLRAFTSLLRLLRADRAQLAALRHSRNALHARVLTLATRTLGLPADPEDFYPHVGGRQKGRAAGKWESRAKYFSLRRRRKRDWNETLRLYDKADYPQDE